MGTGPQPPGTPPTGPTPQPTPAANLLSPDYTPPAPKGDDGPPNETEAEAE